MSLSGTVNGILSLLSQNLTRSRDTSHIENCRSEHTPPLFGAPFGVGVIALEFRRDFWLSYCYGRKGERASCLVWRLAVLEHGSGSN